MLTSTEIRAAFLDFFRQRQHAIVPSAPLVSKDDPTLLFVNSGMAPFKDIFTGRKPVQHPRIADTQKCLRVSGKHNDLEEVGYDTYHHTLFEMLGNWSFGDYFKREAIQWSFEFLSGTLGLDPNRMYATYFEGADGVPADLEAKQLWEQYLHPSHVLPGNKKDNFWEMGATGPCGPCTEIHYDSRAAEAIQETPGHALVNKDSPLVVEIWNNVFMQFNRKDDGSLEPLAMQSVDTGMGFERLCMVLQGKQSTYDTDVFTGLIRHVERLAGREGQYKPGAIAFGDPVEKADVAIRVAVDHIRAIALAIADGQLPGAGGAGYVIRRLIRRASRYGYQFLGLKQPFLHTLVPVLADYFKGTFDELVRQQDFVKTVIEQEEKSFLNTLEKGLSYLEDIITSYTYNDPLVGIKRSSGNYPPEMPEKAFQAAVRNAPYDKIIPGNIAFLLFDTYGFPLDLTQLIARENGWTVDVAGFDAAMAEQKARSKAAAQVQTGDWHDILPGNPETLFVGYDQLSVETEIAKQRTVQGALRQAQGDKGEGAQAGKGTQYHLLLTRTPFYAESGGQVGDTGTLSNGSETLRVLDTRKENNLIVHIVNKLPAEATGTWTAQVDATRRTAISANHSATHLLHAALRQVLGTHVEQRGSLVNPDYLRFDFSHFGKVEDAQIAEIEQIVNGKISAGIPLHEHRDVPISQAKQMGAMALFGEKYGEHVRVIVFDPQFSVELCGGTHVESTSAIRLFKLTSESSSSAGIRRIEAVSGQSAVDWFTERSTQLARVSDLLKHPRDIEKAVADLQTQLAVLQAKQEAGRTEALASLRKELSGQFQAVGGKQVLVAQVAADSADELKQLAFDLRKTQAGAAIVLGTVADGKPLLAVILDEALVQQGLDAKKLIGEIAKDIQGGGGGQPFFATAGGKNAAGLSAALAKAKALLV